MGPIGLGSAFSLAPAKEMIGQVRVAVKREECVPLKSSGGLLYCAIGMLR